MAANLSEHRVLTGEASRGRDTQPSTYESLRQEVEAIAESLQAVAEQRARWLKNQTDAGLVTVRQQIRRHPGPALGIAMAAGALLAVALVPRAAATRRSSSWGYGSLPVTRADLEDLADSVQRSVARAVRAAGPPVASSLNSVVDAVTSIDPKGSITPLVEKVMAWVDRTRTDVKSANGSDTSSAKAR